MRILTLALLLSGGLTATLTAQVDEVTAALESGGSALRAGDLETARSEFERALGMAPDNPGSWLGLCLTLERSGLLVEALGAVRQAQRLAPSAPGVALALGRVLAGLGRTDEALQALGQARALAPTQPEAYVLAALILRDTGQVPAAIGVLEAAADEGADHPAVARELGFLLLSEGRAPEAAEIAARELDKREDQPESQLLAGLALARDPNRQSAAVDHLRRALELGITDPGRIQLELATVLASEGRDQEALAAVEEAVRLMPSSPEAYYRLGAARRAVGNGEGATAALGRFQALNKERAASEEAARARGIALNDAQALALENRSAAALEKLGSILAEDPASDRALSLRAKVFFSLGQIGEALRDISEARTIAPARVEYHYLEGLFLMQAGEAARAEAPLLRALTLEPASGETLHLLGGVAAKRGQPGQAVEYFRQAVELGSDSPSLRLGYAAALESLGRIDEHDAQMAAYRRLKGDTE